MEAANDTTELKDDIKAEEWLKEIGLKEYADTFELNFAYGGRFLSRKRLAQVKISSFPSMNIQNFDHQKEILEHIRHTLKHAFISTVRIQEVKERMRRKREARNENNEEEEGEGDGEGEGEEYEEEG